MAGGLGDDARHNIVDQQQLSLVVPYNVGRFHIFRFVDFGHDVIGFFLPFRAVGNGQQGLDYKRIRITGVWRQDDDRFSRVDTDNIQGRLFDRAARATYHLYSPGSADPFPNFVFHFHLIFFPQHHYAGMPLVFIGDLQFVNDSKNVFVPAQDDGMAGFEHFRATFPQ